MKVKVKRVIREGTKNTKAKSKHAKNFEIKLREDLVESQENSNITFTNIEGIDNIIIE